MSANDQDYRTLFSKHGKTGAAATLYLSHEQLNRLGPVVTQARKRFIDLGLPPPSLNRLIWTIVERGISALGHEAPISLPAAGSPQDPSVDAAPERGPYGTNPDDNNIVPRDHPDFDSMYSDFGPK